MNIHKWDCLKRIRCVIQYILLYSSLSLLSACGGGGLDALGNRADHAYSVILGGSGQTTSSNNQTIPAIP